MTEQNAPDDPFSSLLLPSGLLNDELLAAIRGPQAKVVLPTEEELAVRLIPEQALIQLFELEKEGSLLFNFFAIAIGAGLAFVVNIFTATEFKWTPQNAAFASMIFTVAALAGVFSMRARARADAKRAQILKKN